MFVCDSCGQTRKGQPHMTDTVVIFGVVDDVFDYCFLCIKDAERAEARLRKAEARELLKEASK